MTANELMNLTARDLMRAEVVAIPETMSMRAAGERLRQARISGAPVVDGSGICVGVISASDFLKTIEPSSAPSMGKDVARPKTCSNWAREHDAHGNEIFHCLLPHESCQLQHTVTTSDGREIEVCRDPFSVPTDWQVVETEEISADEVRRHMTADVVSVSVDAPIREVARMMIDAGVHRLIVLDSQRRPIGIVAGTDVLAAVARCGSHAAWDTAASAS